MQFTLRKCQGEYFGLRKLDSGVFGESKIIVDGTMIHEESVMDPENIYGHSFDAQDENTRFTKYPNSDLAEMWGKEFKNKKYVGCVFGLGLWYVFNTNKPRGSDSHLIVNNFLKNPNAAISSLMGILGEITQGPIDSIPKRLEKALEIGTSGPEKAPTRYTTDRDWYENAVQKINQKGNYILRLKNR